MLCNKSIKNAELWVGLGFVRGYRVVRTRGYRQVGDSSCIEMNVIVRFLPRWDPRQAELGMCLIGGCGWHFEVSFRQLG